jgi:hypothetical protein
MNENELIAQALKEVKTQLAHQDIFLIDKSDPIMRLAKKELSKERSKKKPIKEWNNNDFLRYISQELKIHDASLERASKIDLEFIAKLYDNFVLYLGNKMDNEILKKYIEWWVGMHGKDLRRERIYVTRLMGRFDIERFLARYKNTLMAGPEPKTEEMKQQVVLDAETIYNVSGLSALIIAKGIVITGQLLETKHVPDALAKIAATLQTFSKSVMEEVMDKTINNGPYSTSPNMIDFISLAKSTLQRHGLKQFMTVNYRNLYRSN